MFWTLAERYLGLKVGVSTNRNSNMGLHPDYQGFWVSSPVFGVVSAEAGEQGRLRNQSPVVGILLYRKHVITKQPYIPQLIRSFEQAGLIPLPILSMVLKVMWRCEIGWLAYETTEQLGNVEILSVRRGSPGRCIVSTIGFPLVGGPAGSMEAGRGWKSLNASSVPKMYHTSSPHRCWFKIFILGRGKVGGLQSVVLYALPELDGAMMVPLGGLVGETSIWFPNGCNRWWAAEMDFLRQTPPAERRIAIVLYGFPPGLWCYGTAALLNVPAIAPQIPSGIKTKATALGIYRKTEKSWFAASKRRMKR